MAEYLISEHREPQIAEGSQSIQQIADALTGAGLRVVKLQDLETAALRNALERCDGNRTHAAQQLGICVRTLHRKIKGDAGRPELLQACQRVSDAIIGCPRWDR